MLHLLSIFLQLQSDRELCETHGWVAILVLAGTVRYGMHSGIHVAPR
ncbi:hypothetical protein SAMN04488042_104197 [Shimia aestuarii]|uniref:Uncharacterized protein n=1 Tax=Shimia aestuarii TaxID=254406 RepID=A0A1I4NH94_9RHOB|nr:hypothetical protein SAMN04488042_104197 [Shimia aestuarii]